ncbi:class I SAM-dependent methyltransferase [Jeotgalibacillus sp. R-1-5s-1]|uniref:class I SAM-dependent methyltransferase n=1 Tax=Jeotgalibacillus sp. R-1-5s-1 TaxID=2555897 RepID=UPI00106D3BBD|nr:class I SAM-dependent methyltransferase [Jeotgalibacillus sp. R-1-5s-1]TFE00794.1 class I SAM-dependent methyltransferase [Jeotgalibacillus sp. R-1-5s-1]
MTNTPEESFDQLAKAYDQEMDHASPFNTHYERPAMMKELPDDLEGLNVLDAGCSAGWYAEQLVNRGASVTGIDISSKMIKAAKYRLKERASFFQHDLSQPLPFEDNSFDVVVSSLTLHYLKDWNDIMSEVERILKPGGIFLYSTHHPFMDFIQMKEENYFEKKLLHDVWTKGGKTVEVSFYRRSLQEIVQQTLQYFDLKNLIEPLPIKEMEQITADRYEYLTKNPHFLIIKAGKRQVNP